MTYDAADDGRKCYELAIAERRKELLLSKAVQIGDATLYNADCLEILPLLGKVDAVVTDVPYGISQKSGGLRRLDYGEWDKEKTADTVAFSAIAALPPSEHTVVWCADRQLGRIYEGFSHLQRRILVWSKPNPTVLNGTRNFLQAQEFAAHAKKNGAWFGGHCIPSEWRGTSPIDRQHPTQKPVALMSWCVKNVCPPDGIVLDCFMGSGTTGVACANLGRKFIGIELEPKYFDIACKRIEEAYAQPDLFVPAPAAPTQETLL